MMCEGPGRGGGKRKSSWHTFEPHLQGGSQRKVRVDIKEDERSPQDESGRRSEGIIMFGSEEGRERKVCGEEVS